MPGALALWLWVIAAGCFIASWVTGDRRLLGAGAAAMVLYITVAARRRTGPPT
jgi:hypothetical protein